ncbi:MAG TPA: amidase family protein [Geminicoccus sp.]|jgi:amidase|uniref:amidase n=1 Tax=Geminicoccus sp. TaxID=2024832 RepID=UPI002E34C211|nr:amidase family protein [Geminicoccus sp.]HEX2529749.1 amidase family protein [Geminicoccus sp.]
MEELWRRSARDMVAALRRGDVRPVDAIEASLARIATVDPLVNAVPTLCRERALAHAARLESLPPDRRGPLAGLPVLVKDLVDVQGVRTTYGSPIWQDHVPERSDVSVERIEAAGGIVLGKTNTPEFGAGAVTFNEVFGVTSNPWDTGRTPGGSSGGSAVALATGEAWLATGSDLGGSLRTPASFCGIVGFRPSPALVPTGPQPDPFQTLAVDGPMARDVRDLALFLDVMAGHESRDPLSFPVPAGTYASAAAAARLPARIAFSTDLGGITPVDAEVAEVCGTAVEKLRQAGIAVAEATPDFREATEAFTVLRAAQYATNSGPLLENHRDKLKPEVIWNIEKGLSLDAGTIGKAARARGDLQRHAAAFLADHELLLTPAAIVPPFTHGIRYLAELNGYRFPSYIDWVAIAYAITLTALPAMSIPCGFTRSGLPVGLQLVGRPRGEAGLLQQAAAIEDLFGLAGRVPIDPKPPAST